MKVFKRVIFVVILVIISVSLLLIENGYNMYKEAFDQMPLAGKVESIRKNENYTKIEEVPQIYMNLLKMSNQFFQKEIKQEKDGF